ncbi:MAG: tetratricopeptide repeat protein, partial [Bacteroidota bacterium]
MKKSAFTITLSCLLFQLFAQTQSKIDSLETVLKTSKEDTTKVNVLNNLSWELINTAEYAKAKQYADDALAIAEKINFKKGTANAYGNIGIIYYNQGNYPDALKNYFAALKIREEMGGKKGIAACYNNIGLIYYDQGIYPEALKNYFASLKISEEIGDKQGIAACHNNIGRIYELQGNYPEALKNHFAALKIREEIGYKQGIATSYLNIGNIYHYQGNDPEALKNYFAALKIFEEIGYKEGIATSYLNIGSIYGEQGNYPDALKNMFAALKIREEIGDKNGIAYSYNSLGEINTKLKKYTEAKKYFDYGLSLSKEIGSKDDIKASYSGLAALDSATATSPLTPLQQRGEHWKDAYLHHKLYVLYRDSLVNEESTKKLTQAQMQYEFDKKEIATKSGQDKKDALAIAEIKQQKLIKNSTLCGVGIAGIFSFLLVRSFNRRRKTSFEKQVSMVETKALRSQMNPHFIFNSLNSIDDYMRRNDPKNSSLYLNKFSKLMRMILESSRNEEVSIKEDIESLELYIQLENMGMKNKVTYTMDIDPEINTEQTMIPPLLLQPFVENSFKHAFSGIAEPKLEVKISLKDNLLHCSVTDNGKGRNKVQEVTAEANEKRKSLGMAVTKERLDIISKIKKSKAFFVFDDLLDS